MRPFRFRRKFFDVLICLALFAAVAALVVFPKDSVDAAANGVKLCINVIVPSLFPFFVLSTLIVQLGLARHFGRILEPVMRPLFNVGGECVTAFVLGFIGGYPVGAKTVIALYENGSCSRAEAERLLSFCNNSGPAFIFGVVGAGVFASSAAGIALYLAHTLASVIVGVMFRYWGSGEEKKGGGRLPEAEPKRFTLAFTDSVKSAFQTTLNICGFVIFFTVFIRLLFLSGLLPFIASVIGGIFGPFGFDKAWAERLLTGVIELTSGVTSLQGAVGEFSRSLALAAFMLGWAGLSIHCQVLSFIGDSGLSVRTYIYGKILQGSISAVFAYFLARIFVFKQPAAVYLAQQVKSYAAVDFVSALLMSCLTAALLLLLLIIGARKAAVRRGKYIRGKYIKK
ncbi:sporulation integral membrane protein YlbJ [Sporobacter termitidis DSM 10068]|uniref:Sporulation integral membrane protein YlbJ n=1 Tax=Sporobacter termitidis DSM 10068 TaxID=1123282 RepID=A0A1M5WY81_9FIRM|nr:nucleoside recognition domain-containing protein [Sporobacter termitidis]SHH92517.1 sporulation integral membrane protein YlbJ [Sporobacter termitidis DSM 10068]